MADITDLQRSDVVRLVGAGADGSEQNPIGSTANREILAHDVFDNGWTTSEIIVASGATAELKVGGSVLANRKGVFFQSKSTSVSWGHSISILPFDCFKNQFFSLPIGDGTTVYFKNNGGSDATIAIGELA